MKSGCFIKGLIISTIVLAVVLYLAINRFGEYIARPINDFVLDKAVEQSFIELKEMNSAEADSIISLLLSYRDVVHSKKELVVEDIDKITGALSGILQDSSITMEEIELLREKVNTVHER